MSTDADRLGALEAEVAHLRGYIADLLRHMGTDRVVICAVESCAVCKPL